MQKHGSFLHILITAAVGVVFFIIGELLLGVGELLTAFIPFSILNLIVWSLWIAVYFLAFGAIIYLAMYMLNKWRGDYRGWCSKNLGEVVKSAFKKGALALIVIFLAAGVLEFIYQINAIKLIFPSSIPTASSYVFVIDDSGSMEINDPEMKRVDAISEIMKDEPSDFKFAIYRFDHTVQKIRDMAPYQDGEIFAFGPTGGTDIVAALRLAVDDIKSGVTDAGSSPRILLLSDGVSDEIGLDAVLSDCNANNIVVSTIHFDAMGASGGSPLLEKIAERTGGAHSVVQDANLLSEEMNNAIRLSTDSDRHLLSDRAMSTGDPVYMILRVFFLAAIGVVFSWMKQKCYCSAYDHGFADKVFIVSIILCSVAAILVEALFKLPIDTLLGWVLGMPFGVSYIWGAAIRLLFCVMWAICPGFFLKETGGINLGDQYSLYDKKMK